MVSAVRALFSLAAVAVAASGESTGVHVRGRDEKFSLRGVEADPNPLDAKANYDGESWNGSTPPGSTTPAKYAEKEHLPRDYGDIYKGFRRGYRHKSTYPEGWFNEFSNSHKKGYEFPTGLKGDVWFESTARGLMQKFMRDPKRREEWVRAENFELSVKSMEGVPVEVEPVGEDEDIDLFPRREGATIPKAFLDDQEANGPRSPAEPRGAWSELRVDCETGRSPLTVRNDICMMDFNGQLKESRPAEFPNLHTVEGTKWDWDPKFLSPAVKRLQRLGLDHDLAFSPEWTGENGATLEFKGTRGRNALQCTVTLFYKPRSQNLHFSQFKISDDGTVAKVVAAFRVYPFDMMREADEQGYVRVPMYSSSMLTERTRGWVSVSRHPAFWIHTGKFAGWAKVKLSLLGQAQFRGPVANPRLPSDPAQRPAWASDVPSLRRGGRCPLVFAHRGVTQPGDMENSASMVRNAYDRAVPGIEADVFLMSTKNPLAAARNNVEYIKRPSDNMEDYAVVLTHDGNVQRHYGVNKWYTPDVNIDSDKEDAIVRLLGYHALTTNARFMHCEPMASLDDVFKELRKYPVMLNVDAKPNDPRVEPFEGYNYMLGAKIGALVRKYGVEDKVIVSGFSPKVLAAVNDKRLRKYMADEVGHDVGGRKIEKSSRVATGLAKFDTSLSGKFLGLYHFFKRDGLEDDVQVMHLDRLRGMDRAKKDATVGVYTMYDYGVVAQKDGGKIAVQYDPKTLEEAIEKRVSWIETDDPMRLSSELFRVCARLNVPVDWIPKSWGAGDNAVTFEGDDNAQRGVTSVFTHED